MAEKKFTWNGVSFNLDAMKEYTKSQFIKQNKARFKDPEVVWSMIEDKIGVKKTKSRKKKKAEKEESQTEISQINQESNENSQTDS